MLLVGAAARARSAMAAGMARQVWDAAAGEELQGKTLAIIGCGGIGRSVARIASVGYGMQVVGCSRPDAPPPAVLEHFDVVTNDFAIAGARRGFRQPAHVGQPRQPPLGQPRTSGAARRGGPG
jgi:phosphoglycerate dehydrogenase-like enzyme